ncbi:MAG: hypothetical protein JXR63_13450 [Spirochaetales bacterium]|nr:hypothetical protein [Spirochaetales bacterium]
MKKKLLGIVALFAATVMFMGCYTNPAPLVGTWKCPKVDGDRVITEVLVLEVNDANEGVFTWTIFEDGQQDIVREGKYLVSRVETALIIRFEPTVGDPFERPYTLRGGILKFIESSGFDTFLKSKDEEK